MANEYPNGEILAMCSTPSFDSNKFIGVALVMMSGIKISEDERKPFLNKA